MDTLKRYLPTDITYYFRGGGVLFITQILDWFMGFIVLYIFTNFTDKVVYATYGYLLSALAVAALTASPGVETAIQYAAARGNDGGLAYGTRRRLRTVWLGSIGLIVWTAVLYTRDQTNFALAVFASAAILPFLYGMAGFKSYLIGKSYFSLYAVSTLVIEIGKLIFIWIAVRLLTGASIVIGFFITIAVLNSLFNLFYIKQAPNNKVGEEFDEISSNLTLAAVVGGLASHADRLIVGTFFSLETMALYSLAVSVTDPVRNLGVLGAKLLFPKMVQINVRSTVFRRKFAFNLALVTCCLVLLIIAYELVFPVLLNAIFPKYVAAMPIIRYISIATALSIWGIIAAQALWAFGDLKMIYITQVGFPLLRIAILAIGAIWSGITGILWARIGYSFLVNVILIIILLRLFKYNRATQSSANDASQ